MSLDPAPIPSSTLSAGKTSGSSPVKLLLIDDKEANLTALQAILGDLGYPMVLARSGTEALRYLLRGEEFALILMDVRMPGMDGFETAELIRERLSSSTTPIIFLTASTDARSMAFKGYQTGAVDYLLKPIDPEILRTKVTVFLELARAREQLKQLLTEREHAERQLAAYAAELRERNQQLEEDLRIAREMQQALLPTGQSRFPASSGVSASGSVLVVHHYLPTDSVGGDFFSVLPLSETEEAILIGDVMGHGVRAALVTAMLRGLVQQIKSEAHDPGNFLRSLNRALINVLRPLGRSIFTSAFCLVVDIAAGRVRYANAGHPAPLIFRPDTGRVEALKPAEDGKFGPVLGIFEDATYSTVEIPIESGGRILLFTDGLFEVEGAGDDLFDEHRLREAVHRRAEQPLDVLFPELLTELRHFSRHQRFEDDVCLIGMEMT
ncbi:PP2C family protein-serine/threonine phosphatase [Verrucomicrobiota bacterium sgz303538]